MQSIYSAASGLKNMQARLDTIASNISNVSTTGYKSKRLDFKDALYKALEVPDDPNKNKDKKNGSGTASMGTTGTDQATDTTDTTGQTAAANTGTVPVNSDTTAANDEAEKIYVLIGSGVTISSTTSDFSDGAIKTTGIQTDLALSGRGFFTLMNPSGDTLYTRNGNFVVSSDGYLVNSNGYYVLDSNGDRLQIPSDHSELNISADGSVRINGQTDSIGTLGLADFNNPDGLESVGNTCYKATMVSGEAMNADKVYVQQGSLENSNVELADDMTMLVRSQRAFSMISKALQTADDMEGLANNIHK